jgi:hypothetical protein
LLYPGRRTRIVLDKVLCINELSGLLLRGTVWQGDHCEAPASVSSATGRF